jgi:hypothetical protein
VAVDGDTVERQEVVIGAGAPGPCRARGDVARLGGGGLHGLVEVAVGVGKVDYGMVQLVFHAAARVHQLVPAARGVEAREPRVRQGMGTAPEPLGGQRPGRVPAHQGELHPELRPQPAAGRAHQARDQIEHRGEPVCPQHRHGVVGAPLKAVVEGDDDRALGQRGVALTRVDQGVHIDRLVTERGEPPHLAREVPHRDGVSPKRRMRRRRHLMVHEDGHLHAPHDSAPGALRHA